MKTPWEIVLYSKFMTSVAKVPLHVGDEDGFIFYEENVVYEMQRLWKGFILS